MFYKKFALYAAAGFIACVAADAYIAGGLRSAFEAGANSHRGLRTQRDVVLELRAKGIAAVPYVPPNSSITHDRFPVSAIAARKTVFCTEAKDVWTIYDSDSHGFNNPGDVWDRPTEIMALGNSFVHGACVEHGRGMVDLIRKEVAGTINLGLGGNGPLMMLAALREYGPARRPKKILWFFVEGNDLDALGDEANSNLVRYLSDPKYTQGLIDTQSVTDQGLIKLVDRLLSDPVPAEGHNYRRTVTDTLLLRNLRQRLRQTEVKPPPTDLLGRVLGMAKSDAAAWGGTVCFVNLPTWQSLNQPTADRGATRKTVLNLVRANGIPAVDLYPDLLRHATSGEALFVYPGSHYNASGYALVARLVSASLRDCN